MHSDVASVLGLLAFVSVVTAASCNAEVVVDTETEELAESVAKVLLSLEQKGYIAAAVKV